MKEPRTSAAASASDDGEPLPLSITFAEMVECRRHGLAQPFSETVQQIIRYGGAWWIVYERGWLLVTDHDVAQEISRLAQGLREDGTSGLDRHSEFPE